MDEEAEALAGESVVDGEESLGGWALEVGCGVVVKGGTHEVVRGGVADVEMDGGG